MGRDGDFKTMGGVDWCTEIVRATNGVFPYDLPAPLYHHAVATKLSPADIAHAFDILANQAIDGHAHFALACDGFNHLNKPRTWWQRYTKFVGPGLVKARCRKILLRQIDEWTPHPKLETHAGTLTIHEDHMILECKEPLRTISGVIKVGDE